jgi:hypothetical protein
MIMKLKRMNWLKVFGLVALTAAFPACNDEDGVAGKGEAQFEITDAPSDDANIKSVMVTVADVRVNGTSIEGFTKQTIDLKAYSEGNTKVLGNLDLDAKSYSNLLLVLDLDHDASGNEPGCYVETADDMKYKLKSTATGTAELALNKSWTVASDAKTRVIMDFDLRKALKYSQDASVKYTFVADENLKTAVRVVTDTKAGTIQGTYEEDTEVDAEKIIVYAYKKGTFNASTETQESDGVMFRNAVASAEVKESLTGYVYTLAYLEEGDYELHFVGYNQSAETGRLAYSARLQSQSSVNGSVGDFIHVKAGVTVNISSSVTGIF